MTLKAPFPWFGGKSRAASLIWQAFGDPANYVEPFFGSGAVLLGRKTEPKIETVNDLDCYLANFWRAVQQNPEGVAHWADWPVNEADLHARHRWLVAQADFRKKMHSDPDFYDVKIAGWWVWGLCMWIGGGWCAASNWGEGAARTHGGQETAETEVRTHLGCAGKGVHSKGTRPAGDLTAEQPRRPELFRSGKGVVGVRHRDLSNSAEWQKRPSREKGGRGIQNTSIEGRRPSRGKGGMGVHRTELSQQLPNISGDSGASGRGIHASALPTKLPSVGRGGRRGDATAESYGPIRAWMLQLAERLRRVRVCCGDWSRVLGRSVTELIGTTGILFDPPYLVEAGRDPSLYSVEDATVAIAVREWCIANGNNPKLRIALCGYEGEHEMPANWQCVSWKAVGGYAAAAGNTENAHRERIWFSPACLRVERAEQMDLLGVANG